jgi:hypothetical protein
MGQVPIEHKRWYDIGYQQGSRALDDAQKLTLRNVGAELMEHRRFMARIAQEKNLPKWIKKRAAQLAQKAETETRDDELRQLV